MTEPKLRFILFRNDGRVRVFTNKRPPTGQGPVVIETEDLKRKMVGISYSNWKYNPETKEVYAVEPKFMNVAALLIPEDQPLPKFVPPKAEPMKKQRGVAYVVTASAGAGVFMGFVLKLLLDLI